MKKIAIHPSSLYQTCLLYLWTVMHAINQSKSAVIFSFTCRSLNYWKLSNIHLTILSMTSLSGNPAFPVPPFHCAFSKYPLIQNYTQ